MRYVSPEEVLVLHARVMEETSGLHGVRDVKLLKSACARPRATFGGKPLYKNVFEKIASLLESLSRNHPFLDGNKRTALAVALYMLYKNEYELSASNRALVRFALRVAAEKMSIAESARWLRKHSKKL